MGQHILSVVVRKPNKVVTMFLMYGNGVDIKELTCYLLLTLGSL